MIGLGRIGLVGTMLLLGTCTIVEQVCFLQGAEKESAKPTPAEWRRIAQDKQQPAWRRAEAGFQLAKQGNPEGVLLLRQMVHEAEWSCRYAAAQALGELADRESATLLRQMLQDPEKECRYAAAWALAKLGDPAGLHILRQSLRERTSIDPVDMIAALEKVGKPAVGLLQEAVGHQEPEVRLEAMRVLRKLGDRSILQLPPEVFSDVYVLVGMEAVRALEDFGQEGIAGLRQALQHGRSEVRQKALLALHKLGEPGWKAIGQTFNEASPELQRHLVRILPRLGKDGLPLLAAALEDQTPSVQLASLEALVQVGEPAIPLALKVLESSSEPSMAAHAARTLQKLGPAGQKALLEILQQKPQCMSALVIETLEETGPPAIPILRTALNSQDSSQRRAAVGVLGKLQAKETLPELARLVEDPDSRVRSALVHALCDWNDPQTIGILQELFKKEYYYETQQRIIRCLSNRGPAAIEALLEILQDQNPLIHREAAKAFQKMGQPGRQALYKVLQSPDPLRRAASAYALAALRDYQAIPALRETLKDPVRSVRLAAARALKNLDEQGKKVLQEATHDPNWRVRTIAHQALQEDWDIPPLADQPEP